MQGACPACAAAARKPRQHPLLVRLPACAEAALLSSHDQAGLRPGELEAAREDRGWEVALREAQSARDRAQREAGESGRSLASLRAELASLQAEKASLQGRLAEAGREIAEGKADRAGMEHEMDAARRELRKAGELLTIERDAREVMGAEVARLGKALEEAGRDLEAVTLENRALREGLERGRASLAAAEEDGLERQRAERECSQAQARAAEQAEMARVAREAAEELRRLLHREQGVKADLEEKVAEAQRALAREQARHRDEVAEAQRAVSREHARHAEEVAELRRGHARLTEELEGARERGDRAERAERAAAAEREDLARSLKRREEEHRQALERASEVHSSELGRLRGELEARLRDGEDRLASLVAEAAREVSASRSESQSLLTKLSNLSAERDADRARAAEVQALHRSLKAAAAALEGEARALRAAAVAQADAEAAQKAQEVEIGIRLDRELARLQALQADIASKLQQKQQQPPPRPSATTTTAAAPSSLPPQMTPSSLARAEVALRRLERSLAEGGSPERSLNLSTDQSMASEHLRELLRG
jgi:hypothetical protein